MEACLLAPSGHGRARPPAVEGKARGHPGNVELVVWAEVSGETVGSGEMVAVER